MVIKKNTPIMFKMMTTQQITGSLVGFQEWLTLTQTIQIIDYFNELNLQSFFGRANINLANEKYLLTAIHLELMALHSLHPENRWGYFPSAALAWKG